MEPQVRTDTRDGLDPAVVRKIKLALVAIGVIGVAVLVYFIVREVQQAEIGKRWDEFAQHPGELRARRHVAGPPLRGWPGHGVLPAARRLHRRPGGLPPASREQGRRARAPGALADREARRGPGRLPEGRARRREARRPVGEGAQAHAGHPGPLSRLPDQLDDVRPDEPHQPHPRLPGDGRVQRGVGGEVPAAREGTRRGSRRGDPHGARRPARASLPRRGEGDHRSLRRARGAR